MTSRPRLDGIGWAALRRACRTLRRVAYALVATSVVLGTAHAEMAARDLVAACRSVAEAGPHPAAVPNDLKSGICVGFFAAISGVLLFEDEAGSRRLGICTPDHLDTLSLLASTERFLSKNPTTMSDRAIVVALSAAKHDYPCHRPLDDY